ncbi:hypothetical protein [Micromonospora sp. NPDC049240]|uniref:hypothetical protein n=1 Tax=Micromonospora sp. NPDC049240 TaxID=3155151 RepID=UPI0033C58931
MSTPRAGDLVHVTGAASPQFVNPIMFRVIRQLEWTTYDGWVWLDGYQLDQRGDAIARRSLFVKSAGLVIQQRTVPTPGRRGPSAPP